MGARLPEPSREERIGSLIVWAVALIFVTGVITWFLFGSLYGVGVGVSPAAPSSSPGVTSVNVYQTISFSPWQGHDQYYPANFTVPAGVPVNFIISSYDNGTNYLPLGAGMVTGTNTGQEVIRGGMPGTPQGAVSTVPANDTAHTFSINHANPTMKVNVIIPPTANISYPVQVFFQLTFPQPGTYIWFCQAPCDPYSMQTPGYMSGTITVQAT